MGVWVPIKLWSCYVGNDNCTQFALPLSAKLRGINVPPFFLQILRRDRIKKWSAKDFLNIFSGNPRGVHEKRSGSAKV